MSAGHSSAQELVCPQVIEQDASDDARPANIDMHDHYPHTLSGGAEAAAAADIDTAVASSTHVQAEAPGDKSKRAGSVLERIAALSNVLSHTPQHTAGTSGRVDQGSVTDQPQTEGFAHGLKAVSPKEVEKPSMSLLDAMMNADADTMYSAPALLSESMPPVVDGQQPASSSGDEAQASKAADVQLKSSHEQQPSLPSKGEDQELNEREASAQQSSPTKAGSQAAKGTLRERMKALGMLKA